MSIPYSKIEELVEAARLCQEKLPAEDQYLHYRDLQLTLQKLIDDDMAERERFVSDMAGTWEGVVSSEREPTKEELNELDAARKEKLADWPHGL
jgi:hypothetical protein